MKKILIEVVCAATAKSYEFLLPAQMSDGVARKKIIEQIIAYEENEDLFQGTETILFCDMEQKEVLNEKFTLEESGIYGGNRLILI